MQKIISFPRKKSILSILNTFKFTENLDEALRTVDVKKLKDTFMKAGLLNYVETKDFLLQGTVIFKRFINADEKIELLNVEDRNTMCSACSLGTTVRAYDVKYKKQESNISVVYTSSFAVNLEIVDSELYDFAWCNFFLSKAEMKELTEI